MCCCSHLDAPCNALLAMPAFVLLLLLLVVLPSGVRSCAVTLKQYAGRSGCRNSSAMALTCALYSCRTSGAGLQEQQTPYIR
jgi:hypothetical protein